MKTKTIAIVGAGLAGLAAGVYARRNGFDVHLFEHHSLPGGVCTSWKRKGFVIDGCLHWLMGARPGSFLHEIYRQTGALDGVHLQPLHHFGRFAWLDEKGQILRSVDLTSDLSKMVAGWRKLSPADKPAIDILEGGIRDFQGFDGNWDAMEEGSSLGSRIKMAWYCRKQLPYFRKWRMSVQQFAERIRDPFLRWQITNSFVPEMPLFFLFMVLGELTSGRLARIEESSLDFAEGVARRLQSLGGRISYRAEVDRILVEKDAAVGVRCTDGTEHRADLVISAADGHSTLFKLLGGRYVDAETRKRYASWPLFAPLLMISFGVGRDFAGEPSSSLFRLARILDTGECPQENLFCKIFNGNPGFAPPGKAVVQVLLEARYEYWDRLAADRPAYDREKQRIAGEALDFLEQRFPGIRNQVEMTDVATPITYVRYTRNYRGAWEGWLMTPEAFFERIPSRLKGLDRFYMAGQWVQPGGGIPAVLMSGRSAIRQICRAEGIKFQS